MKQHIYRKITQIVLGALLFSGMPMGVSAQEYIAPEVTISKEKVKIDGIVCYSHIVIERQTLYSISKAYNVTIDDIYRFNPTLKETGLRKNSIIIIPSAEAMEKAQEKAAPDTAAAPHEEKKPETRKQEDKKQEVRKQEERKQEERKQEDEKEKGKIHVVKWYEDIETIAQKYGVSAESIITANNLEGKKLKSRMKLTIPSGEVVPQEQLADVEKPDSTKTPIDTLVEKVEEIKEAIVEKAEDIFKKKEVNASLLLPLKAVNGTSSRNNMDFYCGALLAVYDLAEEGISTDLSVFDIAEGAQVTRSQIENSDVIIGPISSGDLTRLFTQAPSSAKVVSPLDPRAESLTASYRNLIHAPTPQIVQYLDLVAWMQEDMKEGDRIIIISEKGARQSQNAIEMKAAVDSAKLSYSPFSYSILEGRDITETLESMMTKEGTNRFLTTSESEAFVNDVVRNINLLAHLKYDVTLYAPSKIKGFDNIEVENFHNTNLHVSSTYNINYDSDKVKAFIMKYRALYNTEPNQYAFQGYDVTKYFVEMAAKHGKDWPEHLEESEKSMLQSTYKCKRAGNGGYVNTGTRRVVYGEDWSVKQIR